ncbi:MAG: prolyl-tRNA synthetase associated domain-containing protein [Propylenella sp.]
MPASRADLASYLERLGIATETVEHPPLFTVEQSQALRGEIAGGHTKNLFLKDKKDRVFLVVAEEDAEIDMKSLHRRIGSARLSFGRAELLMELLGVAPGSVTPFGAINDTAGRVTIILDSGLMRHELLNFHPLENTATTTIGRDDMLVFLRHTGHEPQILAVVGAEPAASAADSALESRARLAT